MRLGRHLLLGHAEGVRGTGQVERSGGKGGVERSMGQVAGGCKVQGWLTQVMLQLHARRQERWDGSMQKGSSMVETDIVKVIGVLCSLYSLLPCDSRCTKILLAHRSQSDTQDVGLKVGVGDSGAGAGGGIGSGMGAGGANLSSELYTDNGTVSPS